MEQAYPEEVEDISTIIQDSKITFDAPFWLSAVKFNVSYGSQRHPLFRDPLICNGY